MSVKDYRRRIDREVEQARAMDGEPVLDEATEGTAAVESVDAAGGLRHEDDLDRVRDVVHDRSADPGLRAAALEGVTRTHDDPRAAHEPALERLADADDTPELRLAALHLLKRATFHSPAAEEWRPAFLDAARKALEVDDHDLRIGALEVLMAEGDPYAQQKLLDGLRDPTQALVPVEDALLLLSHDVHAEAHAVAETIADAPPSERARLEALHLLASDPGSAERFAGLFADSGEDPKVRRLAATALRSLAPERFRSVAAEVLEAADAPGLEALEGAGDGGVRRHTEALLRLDE